jgi:hypothetical protein
MDQWLIVVIAWGIVGPILAIGASYVLSWEWANSLGDGVVGSQAHRIVRLPHALRLLVRARPTFGCRNRAGRLAERGRERSCRWLS